MLFCMAKHLRNTNLFIEAIILVDNGLQRYPARTQFISR